MGKTSLTFTVVTGCVLAVCGALEDTIDFSVISDSGIANKYLAMRHYAAVSGFFITANG